MNTTIDKNELSDHIEYFISELTVELVEETPVEWEGIFLSGSFASWLREDSSYEPSWAGIPDVNYYPVIDADETEMVRAAHELSAAVWRTETRVNKETDVTYEIMIDLHPYSITPTTPTPEEGVVNLQLTTRTINKRYPDRYAAHCWHGWKSNYHVLTPEGGDPLEDIDEAANIVRNEQWLMHRYLGMLSYGNALQILPYYTQDPKHLFDGAFRYMKEIMKDGATIGLSGEEYQYGKLWDLFENWDDVIFDYYEERFGEEAAAIVREAHEIENNYWECRKRPLEEQFELISDGIRLKNIIVERGFQKRIDEVTEEYDSVERAFSTLPLWW